jgi:peptidoglycan/xylan/chitin deacetylase (PgdA/CDA1 family)
MAEPMRKGDTVRRALAVEAGVVAAATLARRRPLVAAGLLAAGAAAAWGAFARNSPLYGTVARHGSHRDPRVAITFDDGPGPSTPDVLDALAAAGARATFFVLGRQVAAHPDLVRRMVADGHEVACHGWDHGILVFRGPGHVADQIARTAQAIEAAAGPGVMAPLFRAPHGFRGPTTVRAARRAGVSVAGWTAGVFDSDQPGTDVIVRRTVRALRPGAVVLLHDADGWDPSATRAQTADAVEPICRAARARGLEPVTMGELL